MEHARQQLEEIPGLLPRMAALMGIDFHGEAPDPETVELVMERMWKYNQTYHISQGVRRKKKRKTPTMILLIIEVIIPLQIFLEMAIDKSM